MTETDIATYERTTPARLRRLYMWVTHFAHTPYAAAALFALAFVESSFFPIPPDVLLIPLVMLNRKRWLRFDAIASAGSVLGGVAGYYIGFGLYEFIGQPIVQYYGFSAVMETVRLRYNANAFLAIFGAAFTPIPYKIFTISAGLFNISLLVFVLASVLGRAGRFFAVSGLMWWFGDGMQRMIERYFNILSLLFLGLLIAGFVVL